MKTRKLLALALCSVMLLSMIPVISVPVHAVNHDNAWTTYRNADDYDDLEFYTPAPGYEYTEDGLHMISADYTDCTPFGTIQTKDPVSVKDGVYMELRVDDYAYAGENGMSDHWICFSIWDSQNIAPGNTTDHGQGWMSLCRTPGYGGAGAAQSFISSSGGNYPFWHQGDVSIIPRIDGEGREIYTFEITWDGSNYDIAVCGVSVRGSQNITKHLEDLNPDGEYYIGVTFHTGVPDSNLEATILKFGTSEWDATVPTGSEYKEPEANPNVFAPTMDPDMVPFGEPCLLFDAHQSSYRGDIPAQGVNLEAESDGSFRIQPTNQASYFTWNIDRQISFEAQDFPVISFLVEDPNYLLTDGVVRYCAGEYMQADDVRKVEYSIYDDTSMLYGEKEEYYLITLDLRQILDNWSFERNWSGRIHGLRFDAFCDLSGKPQNNYFFFHYAGIFRSVEEAVMYGESYLQACGAIYPETEYPTEPPIEEPETEYPTEPPIEEPETEYPTEPPMEKPETEYPTEPPMVETEKIPEGSEGESNMPEETVTPQSPTDIEMGSDEETEASTKKKKPSKKDEDEDEDEDDDGEYMAFECGASVAAIPLSLLVVSAGALALLRKKKQDD